jgi:hypothetical protein
MGRGFDTWSRWKLPTRPSAPAASTGAWSVPGDRVPGGASPPSRALPAVPGAASGARRRSQSRGECGKTFGYPPCVVSLMYRARSLGLGWLRQSQPRYWLASRRLRAGSWREGFRAGPGWYGCPRGASDGTQFASKCLGGSGEMTVCPKCKTENEVGLTRCVQCKAILPVKMGTKSAVRYERVRRQRDLVGIKCPKCGVDNAYTHIRCQACNTSLSAKQGKSGFARVWSTVTSLLRFSS